jgi:dolichyl-phosphate beta-glucosyltransferase
MMRSNAAANSSRRATRSPPVPEPLVSAARAAIAVLGCSQSAIFQIITRIPRLRSRYDLKLHSLSIVIPAYNEEKRLPSSLDQVLSYVLGRYEFIEVLVVDDGSKDGTAQCVRKYAQTHPSVRLLQNPGNRGKGYAVRHGMLEAAGEWILSTDADLSSPISELDRLFEAASRGGAQVAIGSRALDRSLIGVHQPAGREYAGRVFNFVMRLITGLPFVDTQCGFKLYESTAARRIFSKQQVDGFGFDVEDLFIAKLLGVKVVEVPVRWNNVEGTKVSLINGLDSFLDPLRVRYFQLEGKYRE